MRYDKVQTSQPFLFKNAEGQKCLLFCRGVGKEKTRVFGESTPSFRRWTIWFRNLETEEQYPLKIPHILKSENVADNVEIKDENEHTLEGSEIDSGNCKVNLYCNPHFNSKDPSLKVQFIVGVIANKISRLQYYLATMDASDLSFKELSNFKIIKSTFSGTLLPDGSIFHIYTDYCFKNLAIRECDKLLLKRPELPDEVVDLSFLKPIDIYRFCPIYNSDYYTLTCTIEADYQWHTFILSPDFASGYELFNAEHDVLYKSSIMDNTLVYTLVEDLSEETRQLKIEEEPNPVLQSLLSDNTKKIKLGGLKKFRPITEEEAKEQGRFGGIPRLKPEKSPSIVKMASNFASAMKDFAESGFLRVTPEQYNSRMDICNKCEFWQPDARMGLGKCLKCGCTGAKQWIATSVCPIEKWGAISKEEVEASKERENAQAQETQGTVSQQADGSTQEPSS
jgi:hypothetical protein